MDEGHYKDYIITFKGLILVLGNTVSEGET
jgi:hypothetical protein